MKNFFIGVVQWANSASRFPVTCFIRARTKKRTREISKVSSKEYQWKPLPAVWPRPFAPPLPDDSQQQTKDQSQSIFFKLPYEIRLQIYELVLDAEQGSNIEKVIHILPKHYLDDNRRLTYIRCYHKNGRSRKIEGNGWQHDCWLPRRYRYYRSGRIKYLLALSKTCRRMYV